MSKQSLLLVDGDTRSLRVLEVSLRKAGFMVTAALSVQDALDKLTLHAPDLIISETTFPDGDGFELRRRVRATPDWSEIPFIFLTAEAAIENKIRGLELGVDDYLIKPIYIKEVVTRINILLQKRQRTRFEERRDGRTRFAGRVQDMPVVDVIQTIEISRKSGVIQFVGERGRQAAIYFRDGRVIDAEAGTLQGEDAVYRLLTWSEGEFEVVFRTVRRREVITMSSQALLMEGMRRLDEWSRLFEQLPPLAHRFEVDTVELAARLADVPDDNNRILRLFDGKRPLLEVIDASDVGDLECLQAISRLYFEELLIDLDHDKAPRRDTGKVPLVEVDGPASVSDEISGPVAAEPAATEGNGAVALVESNEPAPEAPPVSAAASTRAPDAAASAEPGTGPELESEPEPGPVGPLMGGYRPSSLRLIDEAVAAAQAIEPAMAEDASAASADAHAGASGSANGHAVASNSANGHAGNGVSRTPTPPGVAVDGAGPSVTSDPEDRMAFDPAANVRAADREDSGLRMIGSLGRDRAEASGELATMGHARPLRSETARELVTILPRRITRELPILGQELAASLPTPTPTSPVLAPRVAPAMEPSSPQDEPTQRVALPGSGVRAPSLARRTLRLIRSIQNSGPGLGAVLLILLAVVLAGTAVLLRLRRHGPHSQAELVHETWVSARQVGSGPMAPNEPRRSAAAESAGPGAGTTLTSDETAEHPAPGPAMRGGEVSDDAERTPTTGPTRAVSSGARAAGQGPERRASAASSLGGERASDTGAPDATTARAPATSGTAPAGSSGDETHQGHGAGTGRSGTGPLPPGAGGPAAAGGATGGAASAASTSGKVGARPAVGGDRAAEAKAFCDQASNALDEGDFARAFDLAGSALRQRRTARAYMLRARAEQRLGRVSDALSSLDAATELAPNAGAVWEQRGYILWAARRHDEARAAFERFLELDPKSARAPAVLRLLNEPR